MASSREQLLPFTLVTSPKMSFNARNDVHLGPFFRLAETIPEGLLL